MKRFFLVVLCMMVAGWVVAQTEFCQAQLRIAKVTISPQTFSVGDSVSFKVTVKNPTQYTFSGFTVGVTVWIDKGGMNYMDIQWEKSTHSSQTLGPGATAMVSIPGTFKVTKSPDAYNIAASVLEDGTDNCTPYASNSTLKCKCSYSWMQFILNPGLLKILPGGKKKFVPGGIAPGRVPTKPIRKKR